MEFGKEIDEFGLLTDKFTKKRERVLLEIEHLSYLIENTTVRHAKQQRREQKLKRLLSCTAYKDSVLVRVSRALTR
ncbi:MAG TPA: hypothetical protein VG895_02170 [Patescibacteria group bacterium]|nr:hypothetical protein [Patescibacteria group bacterium]